MLTRREWLRRGAHAAAFGLVAAGCGTQAPATSAAGSGSAQAKPQAPAAASALSGKLTVYAALTAANGKALQDAFQQADPTAIAGLDSEGVLSHTLPAAAGALAADLRGPAWFAPFTFNNVLLAHKGMPVAAPKDWPDLTQAMYKDRVEIGNPGYSGTTLAMVGVLSAKLGWSYFTGLKQQGAAVVQSTNTVGTDVASGAKWAGISLDAVGRPLLSQGSPVDMIWPASGTITVPAPAALIKGKESDLTQAFLAWLLTDPAQAVFAKSGLSAVAGPAASGQSHPQLPVDWPSLASGRAAIIAKFNGIFGL